MRNKCLPSKDHCESLPGYEVVIGAGGQPFCVPKTPPKDCAKVIDNPILGASGNLGARCLPLRPTRSLDPNDKVARHLGVGDARLVPRPGRR